MISAATWHAGKTLSSEEVEDQSAVCPICLSAQSRRKHLKIQADPEIYFLLCPDCFGISADKMPLPEVLDIYYSTYYSRHEQELVTFSRPIRLAKMLKRHIQPQDMVNCIIDYGGGDGHIAIELAKLLVRQNPMRVINVEVVDFVDKPSFEAAPNVRVSFKAALEQVELQPDIILASAILEHIPRYHDEMEKLWHLLRSGGIFYARTPFMSPFGRRMRNLDMTYPAHVHDLGHAFWNKALERHGAYAIVSEPSIIESTFASNTPRTLIAACFKLPARILAKFNLPIIWPFYGGWQVIWRKDV